MLFGKNFEIRGYVLFHSYQLVLSQFSGVVCSPPMLFGKNFEIGGSVLIPSYLFLFANSLMLFGMT